MKYISTIIIVACTMVCVIATFSSFCYVGQELASMAISVLSIITTLLIGWQIYSFLTVEKRIDEKIHVMSAKLETKNNHTFRAYQLAISAYKAYWCGRMATAMDIYMQALDEAVIGENDDCINYVIDYLSYTSEKMNKWDDKLYILPNRRRAYENILSKIEGRKDVSDIKFTIKNAEERYEKWSLSNAEADL